MTPSDELALRFLLASGGSLAVGLAVWAMLAACRRCLPEFSLQRSTWLLSQVTVVAAFLVILLPHSERLRLVPPIDLPVTAAAHPAGAGKTGAAAADAPAAVVKAESGHRPWLAIGAQAWLLIYPLGLAYALASLWRARRTLNGLAASGNRLSAPSRHDGFSAQGMTTPALAVIEVDAPISPMLFGLFHPRLLLPRHLRSFDASQQRMIVEHELTHMRRHDLQWMSVGLLLQTLLWFNPCMRLLRARLSWAQELGCDRDVLRGRPQTERKAYAAALVAQLKLQHRQVNATLAFGGVSASTVAARIGLIREPVSAPRGPWARCAALAGLAAVFAASLAFQPAFAWRIAPLAWAALPAADTLFSCTEMADADTGQRLLHEGRCDERVTPASTFNIAVSLMGYDSGILLDEHTPKLPFKPGYVNWNRSWRTATDPAGWIRNSTVWYAQRVTSQLGAERFQRYVDSFNYGNLDVSGDAGKNNGLTLSWIGSSLKISPVEQVAFLRNIVNRKLPLSAHAYEMTARLTELDTLPNGWRIHGKTGTAAPVLANGRDDALHRYGWFVGWASKGGRTVVFARLVLEDRQENPAGSRTREAFLRGLPAQLDAL
jgi:beta-lactamase class D/beta-lactamase regulating signal transducer with metallopeptidase domain